MTTAVVRMLTARDLADAFGVTERTISNWVCSGHLPEPVAVGPRVKRWHPSVIDQYRSDVQSASPGNTQLQPTEEEEARMLFAQDPSDEGVFLNADEVCASLHCNQVELYRIVQAGQLQMVTTPAGLRRFRLADVYRHQEKHLADFVQRMKLEEFVDRNPDSAEVE